MKGDVVYTYLYGRQQDLYVFARRMPCIIQMYIKGGRIYTDEYKGRQDLYVCIRRITRFIRIYIQYDNKDNKIYTYLHKIGRVL